MNGYVGTADRTISSLYATESWNGGVGLTDPDGTTLELKNDSEYESRPLIRFGAIGIPAGATVASATLTITFTNWLETSPVVTGYYLATPWNGTAKAAGLNWKNRDTGATWAVPGARGVGSDLIAGKTFSIKGFQSIGRQVKTVDLDPLVVQGWIDKPATNQGLVLTLNTQTPNGTSGVMEAYPSEAANSSFRPILTITYK